MRVVREHTVHALFGEDAPPVGRPPACDIVVKPRGADPADWSYAVEFKLRGPSELRDIARLSQIRAKSEGHQRGFVIVAGEGANAGALTEGGIAPRGIFKTADDAQYVVRRVCRAVDTSTVKRESGFWVIAFESV